MGKSGISRSPSGVIITKPCSGGVTDPDLSNGDRCTLQAGDYGGDSLGRQGHYQGTGGEEAKGVEVEALAEGAGLGEDGNSVEVDPDTPRPRPSRSLGGR